jgi:DNA-binding MarR family transcriptional regulator
VQQFSFMPTLEEALKQQKFPNEQLKANLNLLYTANWLYNKISAELKPFQITHEQFNVLRILKGSHPESMCQKDILSRMIAPSSNVTLLVKKLVDKKLIRVLQSAKDKREYVITITKTGLTLLSDIELSFKNSKKSYSTLSASESFHLNALLEKLRAE